MFGYEITAAATPYIMAGGVVLFISLIRGWIKNGTIETLRNNISRLSVEATKQSEELRGLRGELKEEKNMLVETSSNLERRSKELENSREENSLNKSITLPPGRGFYVYEYFNSQTGDVVYVGKGTNNRFAEYEDRHLGIRRLRDRGKLGVRILQENIDYSEDAMHIEKHAILAHVDAGTMLYNKAHNPKENQLLK